jgi:CHAT domain-containing protein
MAQSQVNLSLYYARQGNLPAAIFYLKGAVNTIQSIRAALLGMNKALQNSLLKKNEIVYNQLIDWLVDAGRLSEAQQVLAMLKEDEYFDFIRRDVHADSRSTRMSYNSVERLFSDRLDKLGIDGAMRVEQLNELNKQAKLGLTSAQENQRTQLKKQLAEFSKQTTALLNELPQQLHTAKKQPVDALGKENLTHLRATLKMLGHGVVLLQYVVTEKNIRIFLTSPQLQLVRTTEISAKELNRKISEFRRALQNPAVDPRPLGQELYQLLLAPVANDLKQVQAQTLMLSLDGSLRYLPMAALFDGQAYLMERFSLSVYTEVAKGNLSGKPIVQWRVAGLGTTRKIGEFAPLPSVQQELDGIIKVGSSNSNLGVLPGDIYLNENFTQTRFHDVLDRTYPVLHVASHFKFIPGTEAQSFLLLGDGNQLSLADIRTGGWKFNSVDLITLSACETGLGGGRDGNGREIEGFGVLVQKQGAKGVLATLWSVADQSTSIFMQELYRSRQEKHLTKAEALREAQLALINGNHKRPTTIKLAPSINNVTTNKAPAFIPDPAKLYAHPFYWAPFILMGNWL